MRVRPALGLLLPALLGSALLAPAAVPADAAVPAVAVPSRALGATLQPPGDASLPVRVVVNPVTGRTCATPAAPATGLGEDAALLLSAQVTGERTRLAGSSLSGCATLAPGLAGDLLAHPDTYAVVLASAEGETSSPLAPATAAARPFAVGTRTETVLDPTRRTPARGSVPAAAGRRLAVTYYYPAAGATGPAPRPGAAPSAEGPFPVVLFAPGFGATPRQYARTLQAWAEAGYVVVAPLFPGSGGGLPGPPTRSDLALQPGDLKVVLDAVEAGAVAADSWLGGLADVRRVAVAGHSDGGTTAAGAGLLAAYTDRRYDAVLVLAGARLPGAPARRSLPLLVVSGDRDEFNSQAGFGRVFSLGRGPRTWVQAVRGGHGSPFTDVGRQPDVLRALEIAFFDRWLLGTDTGAAQARLAAVPGVTRLRAGSP